MGLPWSSKIPGALNPSKPHSPRWFVVALKDPYWNDHICNNSHKPIEILATPRCVFTTNFSWEGGEKKMVATGKLGMMSCAKVD